MKKIFYILASAIVALGAVACQNEVDENITPNATKEISFTVSFDESTRVEGTVDGKTANFAFEGNETLYVGEAALNNTAEAKEVFTADEANKAILNELFGQNVTATVNNEENGLQFASAEFELAEENNVTLSLACPALYFTVPAETTVALTVNEAEAEYTEGNYFVGIEGTTAAISYSIGDIKVKEVTLNDMANKVYNLGALIPAIAEVNGVKYTDFAKAVAAADGGIVTLVSDVAIENLVEVSGNVTIEGAGHTVSNTGDVFKVLNGGSLTIGEGVTIESATDCGIFTSAGANNVTVEINGTVRSSSTEYAAVQFNGGTTGVELIVNGTIENTNDIALMLPAGGEYTIENGATISGATAIYLKGGNLTIAEGATISANGAVKTYEHMGSGAVSTGDALVVESSDYPAAPATAIINGGTFTSKNGNAVAHYVQNEEVEKATISIKGGTFNTDPSEFVAENFLALKNYKTENMYDVVAEDNIVLSNENQLFWLAEQVAAGNTFDGMTVKLGANITMTKAWTPIGNNADGVTKSFRGNFDGQGNTISKLNVTAEEGAGFFGFKWDGDITNVKFDNATIKGNHFAGVVVGWGDGANYNYSWTISGCEVTNSKVTLTVKNKDNGDKAGAIIGYAYGMNVDKCSVSNTTIKGYRDMGALVGMLQSNEGSECATLTNSTVGDKVTVEVDNTENYKYYGTRTEYNVNNFAGRLATGCVVGDGNTGTATIKFPTLGTGTGWGICGTMNDWGANGYDIEMFIENTAGNVVVARNVYLTKDSAFQFRVDNKWKTQLGAWSEGFSMSSFNNGAWYGSEEGKKANIKVTDITAGNYDIFFATDSYDFYIVSSDSDPRYDL